MNFTGFIKSVAFDVKDTTNICQVMIGNNTDNYLLTISFVNERENITANYNLNLDAIDVTDIPRLTDGKYLLPNKLMAIYDLDLTPFEKNEKPTFLSINGLVSINKGNIYFTNQELMSSSLNEVQSIFNLDIDEFEEEIGRKYKEYYEYIDVCMDDIDKTEREMNSLETLPTLPGGIVPLWCFKNDAKYLNNGYKDKNTNER